MNLLGGASETTVICCLDDGEGVGATEHSSQWWYPAAGEPQAAGLAEQHLLVSGSGVSTAFKSSRTKSVGYGLDKF